MPNLEASDPVAWPPAVPARDGRTRHIWVGRGIMVALVGWLLLRAWQHQLAAGRSSDGWIENSADVAWWLGAVALRIGLTCAVFLALGVLVPRAFPPTGSTEGGRRAWRAVLLQVAAGWGLALVCAGLALGRWPPAEVLLLPGGAYGLGLWLGRANGMRSLARRVAVLAGALGVAAFAAIVCLNLAIVETPLEFAPTRLSEDDKHRLSAWIRDTRPAHGAARRLRLTDAELAGLANLVLERGLAERKIQFRSTPERLEAEASLVLPERWTQRRHYLNVHLAGLIAIEAGHLTLRCDRCDVGRLQVPRIVLVPAAFFLRGLVLDDPPVRAIVGAIERLRPEPGAIETVFRPGALGEQIVPALAQLIWDRPHVAAQTAVYLRRLLETAENSPPGEHQLGPLVQAAFQLAAERSTRADPLLENRAAIFALAILFGHERLEPFVGEILTDPLRKRSARWLGTVTLHGRTDWTRHFLVSAVLVLLSNEAASQRIGLLKEELDAQEGGSGFSFADLLADRAGVRLARVATADAATARRLQAQLAAASDEDRLMPPATELPEGIAEAEFASRYGGTAGQRYRELSDEIDRRVRQLPAP
ncbi:MAG: hypothetical protein JNG90_17095 [Planctomycetaceae bacterium]|nr:hypothetical protein [Planctomycetaceae bacterium]